MYQNELHFTEISYTLTFPRQPYLGARQRLKSTGISRPAIRSNPSVGDPDLSSTSSPLSRSNRVSQKHRHRHGSNATRYGCDEGCFLTYFLKVNIPDQFATRQSVYSNIDNHCPGLDHFSRNQPWVPRGYHQDICQFSELRKVSRFGMADTNSSVLLHQH